MRPLQVWLPTLSTSLADRAVFAAVRTAFQAWNGESIVWLLPGLGGPTQWTERESQRVLAVPAAHVERVYVYHVGENGWVWGPESMNRFPGGRVEGLLDTWINLWEEKGCTFAPMSDSYVMDVPAVEDGSLQMEGQTVPTSTPVGDDSTPAQCALYRRMAVPVRQKFFHLSLLPYSLGVQLPERLAGLCPVGGSIYEIVAQKKTKQIASQSVTDVDRAVWQAKDFAPPYVTEGRATREALWLWPLFMASQAAGLDGGAVVLDEIEIRFGLRFRDLDAAKQTDAWRRTMARPEPVRRVWGPIGLFAALLLERLEAGQAFRVCERCGRVISGTRKKRFCGPRDSAACYRQRRAEDQRRSRKIRGKQLGR